MGRRDACGASNLQTKLCWEIESGDACVSDDDGDGYGDGVFDAGDAGGDDDGCGCDDDDADGDDGGGDGDDGDDDGDGYRC